MNPATPHTAGESLADRAVSKIVFAYAAFAGLWILLSDQIVVAIFIDPEAIALVSIIKGGYLLSSRHSFSPY